MNRRDTSADADEVQVGIWRRMTPQRKLELMRDMTLAIQELAFAEIRQRHPDLPDDEIWLKLAARRLSPEQMRAVYGREVDPT